VAPDRTIDALNLSDLGCPVGRTVRFIALPHHSPGRWRRWTGIEPAKPRDPVSPVLKTVAPTRNAYTSTPAVPVPDGDYINLLHHRVSLSRSHTSGDHSGRVDVSTDNSDPADKLAGEHARCIIGEDVRHSTLT
jgi:hypothetical protein